MRMRSRKRFKSVVSVSGAVLQALEQRALFSGAPVAFGPDAAFGDKGVVTHSSAASGDAVVALANGDTLVAETVPNATWPDHVILQRYLPNGTIDSSFGTGGSAIVANDSSIAGLVRDSSGRILVLLQTIPNPNSASQNFYTSIARVNPNGTLDRSYGSGGFVSLSVPNMLIDGFTVDDKARALLSWNTDTFSHSGLVNELQRFTAQGRLDSSFGGDGIVEVDGLLSALSFQTDGKVLLGTIVNNATVESEPAVIRYNANGSLDTSFGVGGKALSTVPLPPPGQVSTLDGTAAVGCIRCCPAGISPSQVTRATKVPECMERFRTKSCSLRSSQPRAFL